MKKFFNLFPRIDNEKYSIDDIYEKLEIERFETLISIINHDQLTQLKRTIDLGEKLLENKHVNQYQLVSIAKDIIYALETRAEIFCGATEKYLNHKNINQAINDYTRIAKLWEKAEIEPDVKIFTGRCLAYLQQEEWDNAIADGQNIKNLDCRKGNYYLSLIHHRRGDDSSAMSFLRDAFDCDHKQYHEWMELHKLSEKITPKLRLAKELESLAIMLAYKADLRDFGGIDLSFTDYSGDFSGADFNGANFDCVLFSDTNFDGCNLSNASFKNAMVEEGRIVSFIGADLSGATFENACFPNGRFIGANFCKTNLNRANMSNADFSNATFTMISATEGLFYLSKFNNSKIENAIFSETILSNTNFEEAQIISSIFDKAKIIDANFNNVIFKMTSFIGADFRYVTMKNVDFSEITLREANINMLDIEGSINFNIDLFKLADCGFHDLQGVPAKVSLDYYETIKSDALNYLFNNYKNIDGLADRFKKYHFLDKRIRRKILKIARGILVKKYNLKAQNYPYSQTESKDVSSEIQEPGYIKLIENSFVNQDYYLIIHSLKVKPKKRPNIEEIFENKNRLYRAFNFMISSIFRDFDLVDDYVLELEKLIEIQKEINEIKSIYVTNLTTNVSTLCSRR